MLKRLDNINIETKLETRLKQISDNIKEIKSQQLDIINQLNTTQKEIENCKAEIEVLENYSKFIDGLISTKPIQSKKNELIKYLKNQIYEKENIYSSANKTKNEKIEREKNLNFIKIEVEKKQNFKENIKKTYEDLETKIFAHKEEKETIKNKLLLHYHTLLSEGIDTRQEGLLWIIKCIWNLGQNVIMSYMPNYLDEKGIDFIFTIAHKDFKLQKIRKEIEDIKYKLKGRFSQGINSTNKFFSPLDTFKTEIKVFFVIYL